MHSSVCVEVIHQLFLDSSIYLVAIKAAGQVGYRTERLDTAMDTEITGE